MSKAYPWCMGNLFELDGATCDQCPYHSVCFAVCTRDMMNSETRAYLTVIGRLFPLPMQRQGAWKRRTQK